MTHPDENTLQTWFDGELPESESVTVETHVDACAECTAKHRALRGMHLGMERWAEDLPDLGDVTDGVMARIAEAPKVLNGRPANDVTPAPAKVVPLRRPFPARRALFPAMVAAAALFVWKVVPKTPEGPHPHGAFVIGPAPRPAPRDPMNEPVVVGTGDGPGGAEVTGVDVQGAQSYTVMEIAGMTPGVTTAIVWIQDSDEGGASPGAPQ